MEKYFSPYKESLELKKLGFDEDCLAYYTENQVTIDKDGNKTNFVLLSSKLRGELVGHGTVKNSLFKWLKENDRTHGELYVLSNSHTAPLIQQVKEWLREKHKLHIEITSHYGEYYYFKLNEIQFPRKIERNIINIPNENKTYEEAELEAIRECIKIIKNENNK